MGTNCNTNALLRLFIICEELDDRWKTKLNFG